MPGCFLVLKGALYHPVPETPSPPSLKEIECIRNSFSSKYMRNVNYKKKYPSRIKQKVVRERQSYLNESVSILLAVFGVFLCISLYSYLDNRGFESLKTASAVPAAKNTMGVVGAGVAKLFFSLLGYCSFAMVLWSILLARSVWLNGLPKNASEKSSIIKPLLGSLLMAASCATAASSLFGYDGGGRIGSGIAFTLENYVNSAGTVLLSFTLFILSFGFSTGVSSLKIFAAIGLFILQLKDYALDALFLIKDGVFALFRTNGFLVKNTIRITGAIAKSLKSTTEELIYFFVELRNKVNKKSEEEKKQVKNKSFVLGDDVKEVIPRTKKVLGIKKDEDVKIVRQDYKLQIKKKQVKVKQEKRDFNLPTLDLFQKPAKEKNLGPKDDELIKNSKSLEEALLNFKIDGKVKEVHPGPVVTLYEFSPGVGIKVQKIINLADDLALALKVASVRVYAPVPGKGTVGIEVPNAERQVVRLRSMLESPEFQSSTHHLPLALGKNTFGDPVIGDLSAMPHLLIAGATGTGKSVCINSLLMSLLCRNSPEELRMIMIDPKMLELSIYEDIPHLKAPVVTNPTKARGVLWWAVQEMERRYELMKDLGVRSLQSYNSFVAMTEAKKNKEEVIELEPQNIVSTTAEEISREPVEEIPDIESVDKKKVQDLETLPRIVIVVDELADLMLTVGREIEELLTRLAQKARAAGIHMILATQRPSVNVITGLIKANFPSRISFKVASRIDARTILDTSGSERLLGMGDMLFLAPGTSAIKRLHGPFVSDKEVVDVVAWLKDQADPDYDDEIESVIEKIEEMEGKGNGAGSAGDDEYDALYDDAVQYVIEKGQASTSMIQRGFRIGYNRAARILECMEREGIVGPADGAKPRKIYVPDREAI